MLVKAAAERIVPMEQDPRRHITSEAVVQVEETAYYLRAIARGDLVEATQQEWDAQESQRVKEEAAAIKVAEDEAKAKAKAEKTALSGTAQTNP